MQYQECPSTNSINSLSVKAPGVPSSLQKPPVQRSKVMNTALFFGGLGPLLIPIICLLLSLAVLIFTGSFEILQAFGFTQLVILFSYLIGSIPALIAGFLYALLMQYLPISESLVGTSHAVKKYLYGTLSGGIAGLPLALVLPVGGDNADPHLFMANAIFWSSFCAVHGLLCASIEPFYKPAQPEEASDVSK